MSLVQMPSALCFKVIRSDLASVQFNYKYYTSGKHSASAEYMLGITDAIARYTAVLAAMESNHPQWQTFFSEREFQMPNVVQDDSEPEDDNEYCRCGAITGDKNSVFSNTCCICFEITLCDDCCPSSHNEHDEHCCSESVEEEYQHKVCLKCQSK